LFHSVNKTITLLINAKDNVISFPGAAPEAMAA